MYGRKVVWRSDSAACSERTRRHDVWIESFLDLQRESSEEMGNARVVESEKSVGARAAWHGSKSMAESMRVGSRSSDKR